MRVRGTQAPNHKDDAALISRIRAGDQSAMADLYDRYAGVVYGVALRVLGSTTAAEDVVQEVFLQLWRNPQAFDADRGRLAPGLAVIARNRAIDFLRKRPPEDISKECPSPLESIREMRLPRNLESIKSCAGWGDWRKTKGKRLTWPFLTA